MPHWQYITYFLQYLFGRERQMQNKDIENKERGGREKFPPTALLCKWLNWPRLGQAGNQEPEVTGMVNIYMKR